MLAAGVGVIGLATALTALRVKRRRRKPLSREQKLAAARRVGSAIRKSSPRGNRHAFDPGEGIAERYSLSEDTTDNPSGGNSW